MADEALVRRCLELGMTETEIADAGDDLIEVAVGRAFVQGDEQLTLREVAGRAGVPYERAERIIRAGGLVGADLEDPVFNERDAELVGTLTAAEDLLGSEAVLKIVRVAAAAVGRIGDATISTFLTSAAAPALQEDLSGIQLIDANHAAARLLPPFGELLSRMLMRYIAQANRPMSDLFSSTLSEGLDTRLMAIGFADLVGSTLLADSGSLAELNETLDWFERITTDIVSDHGGRVVKFIGDEVMYRAGSAATACRIATDLVEAVRADPRLPPLRVGVAFGEVLTREGDYYGPIVNLAARVTKLSPLHGVMVTAATADALGADHPFEVDALGAIEMKGVNEPVELASLRSR